MSKATFLEAGIDYDGPGARRAGGALENTSYVNRRPTDSDCLVDRESRCRAAADLEVGNSLARCQGGLSSGESFGGLDFLSRGCL